MRSIKGSFCLSLYWTNLLLGGPFFSSHSVDNRNGCNVSRFFHFYFNSLAIFWKMLVRSELKGDEISKFALPSNFSSKWLQVETWKCKSALVMFSAMALAVLRQLNELISILGGKFLSFRHYSFWFWRLKMVFYLGVFLSTRNTWGLAPRS